MLLTRMTRFWVGLLALFALSLAALPSCKSACRSLSEELCRCLPSTQARDACFAQASTREGSYPSTSETEATCEAKLETCRCEEIETPEGKLACGLAREE